MKRWMAFLAPAGLAAFALCLSTALTACSDNSSSDGSPAPEEFLGVLGDPPADAFRRVYDVAVDDGGRVYALQPSPYTIMTFAPGGPLIRTIDVAPGHQIGISNDEIFLLGAEGSQVLVYSLDGTPRRQFAAMPPGEAGSRSAEAFDLLPDGSFVALDQDGARVAHLTRDGNLLSEWGEVGVDDGEFLSPVRIVARLDGSVILYDRSARRFQQFSPDGVFLSGWPLPPALETPGRIDELEMAAAPDGRVGVIVAINSSTAPLWYGLMNSDGTLDTGPVELPRSKLGWGDIRLTPAPGGGFVVSSQSTNRVMDLSASGQPGQEYGHSYGSAPGEFRYLTSLAVSPGGDIWACDPYLDRLTRMSPSGQRLQTIECESFGVIGDASCPTPGIIASSPEGGLFVVVGTFQDFHLLKLDQAGRLLSDGPLPDLGYHLPLDLAVGSRGHLYLLSEIECLGYECHRRIWQVDETGALEAVTPIPASDDPDAPEYTAIDVDPHGRLWAWNRTALRFEIFSPGLRLEETLAGAVDGPAPIRNVPAFKIATNGDIFVDDSDRWRIVRLNFGGLLTGSLPFLGSYKNCSDSRDIQAGPDGRLYVIKCDQVLVYGPAESRPAAPTRPDAALRTMPAGSAN